MQNNPWKGLKLELCLHEQIIITSVEMQNNPWKGLKHDYKFMQTPFAGIGRNAE